MEDGKIRQFEVIVNALFCAGESGCRRGMQPDSLKLTSQLVILKHLHAVAFRSQLFH